MRSFCTILYLLVSLIAISQKKLSIGDQKVIEKSLVHRYPDSEIAKGISSIVLLKIETGKGKVDTLKILNGISKEFAFNISQGIHIALKKIDIKKYESGSIIPLYFITTNDNDTIGLEKSVLMSSNIGEVLKLLTTNHCNIICEPIYFVSYIRKRVVD